MCTKQQTGGEHSPSLVPLSAEKKRTHLPAHAGILATAKDVRSDSVPATDSCIYMTVEAASSYCGACIGSCGTSFYALSPRLCFSDTTSMLCRPFVWRNQIFLGHWMAYLPAQERMAISYLNITAGRVELVHRFTTLSSEIEQTVPPLGPPAKISLRRSLRLLGNAAVEQPSFRCSSNLHLSCVDKRWSCMFRNLEALLRMPGQAACAGMPVKCDRLSIWTKGLLGGIPGAACLVI